MNRNHFIRLFNYDNVVNRQVLDLLRSQTVTDEKTKKTFAHLITSKKVWIQRLTGKDTGGMVLWPDLEWDKCAMLIRENRASYETYFSRIPEEGLDDNVNYQNSKGVNFHTPVRDILNHVLIHGGYHRGQIARAVREAGGDPVNTDYITYVRNTDNR
ncbi:MAG: DinB family protein [Balneolaceae bacterium]